MPITSQETFAQPTEETSSVKLFVGRHFVFVIMMILIVFSAGSATILWSTPLETEAIVGEIKEVVGSSEIVVSRYNRKDLLLRVPTTADVRKNKARSRVTSLEVGDTVRVKYHARPVGLAEAEVVYATSPFITGRVTNIDLEIRSIAIEGKLSRVFAVRDQTVILLNGSLAHLYDLKVGMRAKAEYRDVRDPQLDLLLVND